MGKEIRSLQAGEVINLLPGEPMAVLVVKKFSDFSLKGFIFIVFL